MVEIIVAVALAVGSLMGIGVGAALRTSGGESRREEQELDIISHEEARKRYKVADIKHKR